jgi:hypothetical protein
MLTIQHLPGVKRRDKNLVGRIGSSVLSTVGLGGSTAGGSADRGEWEGEEGGNGASPKILRPRLYQVNNTPLYLLITACKDNN